MHAVTALDYDWIIPGLAQGSYPEPLRAPYDNGFDVVVFSAMELQPKRFRPPQGKTVILIPMDDTEYSPITLDDDRKLREISRSLARHIRAGRKVLTTCAQGRNRSGLLSALTIVRLGHASPDKAIQLVKRKRNAPSGEALTNIMFERYIRMQR